MAFTEVERNLGKLPASAAAEWPRLSAALTLVEDIVSLDRPVIFAASKDRPILFTALAWAWSFSSGSVLLRTMRWNDGVVEASGRGSTGDGLRGVIRKALRLAPALAVARAGGK